MITNWFSYRLLFYNAINQAILITIERNALIMHNIIF